jgi:predicted amidohydrolase YtcJ
MFAACLTLPVYAQTAQTVLINGQILSADSKDSRHQAMAIRDSRIVSMGTSQQMKSFIGPETRVVDLKGRTVIPGLIDSHMHAIRAALSYSTEVHWLGVTSINTALEKLKQAAGQAKAGEWLIVAGGWTEEQFKEGRRPTQAEIQQAAPNNPVYVQWMYDWALLNPAGYTALNIQSEADLPGGGKFALDAKGQPTGAVLGGIVALFDKLPKPNFAQKVTGTQKFFKELNRVGVTGVMDPGGFNMSPTEYAPLFNVWRHKDLTVRVNFSYFAQKKDKELEEFKELTQLLPMGLGDEMLRFNGIGERVAFSMYNNDKATPADQEKLYQIARWAADNGLTLTQHWHEDSSVDTLLDVFERVHREFPIDQLRWSIAHLNNGTEATFQRMKKLGVAWAMQDAMYLEGDRVLHRHGEKAAQHMPPINTALKVGVKIGAGTDAHRVADYNPFIALRWMLDGKTASGKPLRATNEIPSRLQALKLYTSGSAWLAHDEKNRGVLEVGKLADLAVLSQDYMRVPLDKMADTHSVLTMVGGTIVHSELQ